MQFDRYFPVQNKTSIMKPNQPRMIDSSRNYITVGWNDCDSLLLKKIEKLESDREKDETSKGNQRWYVLERRDRLLGWCRSYIGFKTQTRIGPLAPGDYYEFRLKVTTGQEESEWSDTLFALTKDDVVAVAHLHRVVENGPVATLRKILSQRPSSVSVPNKFGQTSLKLAIQKNNINFMGILLNHGADFDHAESGSKRTPLMMAAQRGQLQPVQMLLEKGSSWNTKDRNGLTAFNYAVDNSHFEMVKLAVEGGADVTTKDRFGWTPLMRGVSLNSSSKVLNYLLDNGSDPNETDDRKQTVLMQAVLSGKPEIVELLLSKGADISRRNIYGHSAYDMAKFSTNEEISKIAHLVGFELEDGLNRNRTKIRDLRRE